MKTKILAFFLLFSATMLAQSLEFRTITSDTKIPKELLIKPQMRMADIEILDTVDNFLICRRPVFITNTRQYMYTETFLLDKGLQTVKKIELPKEYSKFTPVYLCKLGNNHFFKLRKEFKKYSLALFDQHMNFIKAEPMENFGLVCKDDNFIYLQNSPIKSKTYDGEFVKVDKDMNFVVRKPVSVLYDFNTYRPDYSAVDTMGHIILRNRGTYICIDRETLDQIELDVTEPLDYYTRIAASLRDYDMYEEDKTIHLTAYGSSKMNVRVCDYKGNMLFNRTFSSPISYPNFSFVAYKNNKVYFLTRKDRTISIHEYNMETESTNVVFSHKMENPLNKESSTFANCWTYDDNSYNVIVNNSEPFDAGGNHWRYNKYISFIHLDENFELTQPVEEKAFKTLFSPSHVFYNVLYTSKEYTLLQHSHLVSGYKGLLYELQFCIWDKSGQQTMIPSGIKYNTLYVDTPNKPVIFEVSPTRYYILTGFSKETYNLVEMVVKE